MGVGRNPTRLENTQKTQRWFQRSCRIPIPRLGRLNPHCAGYSKSPTFGTFTVHFCWFNLTHVEGEASSWLVPWRDPDGAEAPWHLKEHLHMSKFTCPPTPKKIQHYSIYRWRLKHSIPRHDLNQNFTHASPTPSGSHLRSVRIIFRMWPDATWHQALHPKRLPPKSVIVGPKNLR